VTHKAEFRVRVNIFKEVGQQGLYDPIRTNVGLVSIYLAALLSKKDQRQLIICQV
jgi:hypothetical protein